MIYKDKYHSKNDTFTALNGEKLKKMTMIQQQSILKVDDNSGAKTVKCIKILGGFKKRYARLGDVIVVSVQQLRNRSKLTSKVKKGEVYQAVVIKTKNRYKKMDGSSFILNKNAVSLINKRGNPVATRITGPMPKIFKKKKKYLKFISISAGII